MLLAAFALPSSLLCRPLDVAAQQSDGVGIVSGNSGKYLDVDAEQTANGTQIIQWRWEGSANQRWRFEDGHLVSVQSGKCLDVQNEATHDGANVVLWECNGGANQQWDYVAGTFVVRHSGKCLDVRNASTEDGAFVVQSTCSGRLSQRWTLEEAFSGSGAGS
jgi:hypothetical protein